MANNDNFEIQQEIMIPTSPDVVWDYLINQDGLKIWLQADTFLIDIIEGGKISIPFQEGDRRWQVVGETALILPHEKFAFSWIERDEYGDEWFNATFVTLALNPSGESTQLTLTHSGLKNLSEDIRDDAHQRCLAYWGDHQRMTALKSAIIDFVAGR